MEQIYARNREQMIADEWEMECAEGYHSENAGNNITTTNKSLEILVNSAGRYFISSYLSEHESDTSQLPRGDSARQEW